MYYLFGCNLRVRRGLCEADKDLCPPLSLQAARAVFTTVANTFQQTESSKPRTKPPFQEEQGDIICLRFRQQITGRLAATLHTAAFTRATHNAASPGHRARSLPFGPTGPTPLPTSHQHHGATRDTAATRHVWKDFICSPPRRCLYSCSVLRTEKIIFMLNYESHKTCFSPHTN